MGELDKVNYVILSKLNANENLSNLDEKETRNYIINKLKNKSFSIIKENLPYLLNIIVDEITVYYKTYKLRGIIYTSFLGHYTAILVNLNENYNLLKNDSNYFDDDNKNNGELTICTDDYKNLLRINLPFILIYEICN